MQHILIIKHGALGDIILASGPFKAIRQHYPNAHIVLLTTKPYAELLQKTGWFNEIWIDTKPKWQLGQWKQLKQRFNSLPFDWVYDMQTSRRSSFYLKLFDRRPNWSGIAPTASHRHDTPHRTQSHTLDREREQLQIAGISNVPEPDISWLTGDISAFPLRQPYALLVPGGSAHRPEKRWPKERFAELARAFAARQIQPVLIGAKAEGDLLNDIAAVCPDALNLCQRTDFGQIAELARGAKVAVGNDTGPMHIIAATGCPSLVLFSNASNPQMCAPRGGKVGVIQIGDLSYLSLDRVQNILKDQMKT